MDKLRRRLHYSRDIEGYMGTFGMRCAGLFLMTLSPFSQLVLGNDTGLLVDEMASKFDDVALTDDTDQKLRMETLWEWDMTQADGGKAANDADENNHSLFVIGNTVYVYVEIYSPNGITLRRFDKETGAELSTITGNFPSNKSGTSYQRMVMSDDAGHIVTICIPLPTISDNNIHFDIKDSALNTITSFSADLGNNYFSKDSEFLDISGDITSDNAVLSIGGWAYTGSNYASASFYPALSKLHFSNAELKNVEILKLEDGAYTFNTQGAATTEKPHQWMTMVKELDDSHLIVQNLASASNHSPIMLYSADGKTQLSKIAGSADKYCYGVFPFKLGDNSMLITPKSFTETDGIKFSLSQLTDVNDLNSLREIHTFPSISTPYPAKIYDYTLPKVVIIPDTDTSASSHRKASTTAPKSATVYAYMPGSHLGAYKLSLKDNPTPAGSLTVAPNHSSLPTYSLSGRTLTIYHISGETSLPLSLYTPEGHSVMATNVSSANSAIDLSHIPAGIYILRIDTASSKLILK
ncbi:MAG: T9SS type A sorting domain-containing protein [Muribaculaceae bacterium]|nr:T9SS type A sorting domain-containing protein [Muribaculaceae bacterium]